MKHTASELSSLHLSLSSNHWCYFTAPKSSPHVSKKNWKCYPSIQYQTLWCLTCWAFIDITWLKISDILFLIGFTSPLLQWGDPHLLPTVTKQSRHANNLNTVSLVSSRGKADFYMWMQHLCLGLEGYSCLASLLMYFKMAAVTALGVECKTGQARTHTCWVIHDDCRWLRILPDRLRRAEARQWRINFRHITTNCSSHCVQYTVATGMRYWPEFVEKSGSWGLKFSAKLFLKPHKKSKDSCCGETMWGKQW